MKPWLTAVLWVLVGPVALLAGAALLGAGMMRQGSPVAVSLGAALLLALPAMGLSAVVRGRPGANQAALAVWSAAVLVGFELYFPGQRADALAVGLTTLGTPLGLDLGLASNVEAYVPKVKSREVPPPAQLPVDAILPPSRATGEQVALPYEGQGRTLALPVTVEGPGEVSSDVWMLFDTGATLTTLNRKTLDEIGVTVHPDSPVVTVRTAGGERQTQLTLLDRVWVGGLEVSGVTVSVCDACADEHTVGLLGLNVTGRFLVTVDTSREELVLEPREGEPDRSLDVAPWLDVMATARRWEDGRIEVEVSASNKSDRLVQTAEIEVRCEDTYIAELRNIPPKGRATSLVSLPRGTACEGYGVALSRAVW